MFLLSVNDFKQYIQDTDLQIAYATQMVINDKKDAAIGEDAETQWWLRTTGESKTDASCVNMSGQLCQGGAKRP